MQPCAPLRISYCSAHSAFLSLASLRGFTLPYSQPPLSYSIQSSYASPTAPLMKSISSPSLAATVLSATSLLTLLPASSAHSFISSSSASGAVGSSIAKSSKSADKKEPAHQRRLFCPTRPSSYPFTRTRGPHRRIEDRGKYGLAACIERYRHEPPLQTCVLSATLSRSTSTPSGLPAIAALMCAILMAEVHTSPPMGHLGIASSSSDSRAARNRSSHSFSSPSSRETQHSPIIPIQHFEAYRTKEGHSFSMLAFNKSPPCSLALLVGRWAPCPFLRYTKHHSFLSWNIDALYYITLALFCQFC